MCNIVYRPKGESISPTILDDLAIDNPDGYGGMYVQDGELVVVRDLKDIEAVYHAVPPETEAFFHARWATHGTVTIENVHPYVLKVGGYTYGVMHNGIFQGQKMTRKNMSDTWHFVYNRLRHWIKEFGISPKLNDLVFKSLRGSKLAIMRNDGGTWIFGYKLGEVIEGCWYSAGRPSGAISYKYGSNYLGGGLYMDSAGQVWDYRSHTEKMKDTTASNTEYATLEEGKKVPLWRWCQYCSAFGDHHSEGHELDWTTRSYEREETTDTGSRWGGHGEYND